MAVQPAKNPTAQRAPKGQVRPEKAGKQQGTKASGSQKKQNSGGKEKGQKAQAHVLAGTTLVGGALLGPTAGSGAAVSGLFGLSSGEEKSGEEARPVPSESEVPTDKQSERLSLFFKGDSKLEMKVSGSAKNSGSIHLKKPGNSWVVETVDSGASNNKIINDWLQLDSDGNALPTEVQDFIRQVAGKNIINANLNAPPHISLGWVEFGHYEGGSEHAKETQKTEPPADRKNGGFWSFLRG